MRRCLIAAACLTLLPLSTGSGVAAAASGPSHRPAESTNGHPYGDADWPQFRFSSAHLGVNPYETMLSPSNVGSLQKIWDRRTNNAIEGTPAVVGGLVYIPSADGTLYAMDAATGKVIWNDSGGGYGGDSPAVANGLVVVGGNAVSAFDAATGAPVWSVPVTRFTIGEPTIDGSVVYLGDCDGVMFAIDLTSGAELWSKSGLGNCIGTSAAAGDGRIYFGSFNMDGGHVLALDAVSGKVVWKHPIGAAVEGSAPAFANGVVYVGAFDKHLYALDAATGHVIWKAGTGGDVRSSPGVHDGVVYVGSDDGYLYAFDAAQGTPLWRQHIGGFIDWSSPAIANGVIYIAAAGGRRSHFEALDEVTGKVLFRKNISTGGQRVVSPVVVDGMVFIGSDDSRMYAFGLP